MGKGRDYRGPRRRGFDDDMFTPQDALMAPITRPATARSFDAPAHSGNTLDATVKWFNPIKGFGFVELADGSGDAFLHVSILQGGGHDSVEPGTKLKVQIEQGQKGRQVSAVFEVDTNSLVTRSPRESNRLRTTHNGPDPSTAVEVDGTVRWFNPEKGFGFVAADDGGKDVFLHVNVLEKAGRKTISEGEFVVMKVVQSQKGREAVSITVVPPIG